MNDLQYIRLDMNTFVATSSAFILDCSHLANIARTSASDALADWFCAALVTKDMLWSTVQVKPEPEIFEYE